MLLAVDWFRNFNRGIFSVKKVVNANCEISKVSVGITGRKPRNLDYYFNAYIINLDWFRGEGGE